MTDKPKVEGGLTVNAYAVFSRALEEGIAQGWQRSFKHTDSPTAEHVKEQIREGVMNAVCEFFDFRKSPLHFWKTIPEQKRHGVKVALRLSS